MELLEWGIVKESLYFLEKTTEAIDLFKVKYNGKTVKVENVDVQVAREALFEALTARYFVNLLDCKLEDFCVASFLDPRYRNLEFKNLEAWKWKSGFLNKSTIIGWARSAFDSDWRPQTVETTRVAAPVGMNHK
ncbi:hypothetical protein CYMTET_43620, partial [Cymbomonas tetramitiformis]